MDAHRADAQQSCGTPRRPARESMLERMTFIIDAFDDPNEELTLEAVTVRAGLPRSTTHRIIAELVDLGWLARSGRGYALGTRALGALGPEAAHARIRIAASDIVQELYLRTGMVVHLGVLDGAHEYFLDKVGGPFSRALRSRVGSRLAAYRGTGGRSMLALLTPERVDQLVGDELARAGGHGEWTLHRLHGELNRIRGAHGVAFEPGENYSGIGAGGIGSLAAAVRTSDGTVVSLCVAGEARKVQLGRVAPLVRDAGIQLSRAL
ncbi:IclR family transcriptional regulator [Rhodococcus kronopolitis]|uniref:IclR family transcriptional regulator n=1 Tax=Rhodococcus kronopolitis TaxID=1460226 RepID=A0ABV9FWA8_9NOCA